jgi:hypothetical protein
MLPWRQQSKPAFRWAAIQETVRDTLEQAGRISIRAQGLAVNRVLQHADVMLHTRLSKKSRHKKSWGTAAVLSTAPFMVHVIPVGLFLCL